MKNSNISHKVIFPIILALGVICGIFIGKILSEREIKANATFFVPQQDNNKASMKMNAVLSMINRNYVDSLDNANFIEKALPRIMENLDPHSCYIPAADLQAVNSELEGSFSGIGVQFNIQHDTVLIVSVITGGPSEKLGILPGDRIIMVNDSAFVGKKITNDVVISKLRGPKGSHVKVGIKRNNEKETLHFDIVRGDIPITSIDASYMVNDSIGYVKVNRFGENTYYEFCNSLGQLRNLGATKYIIDLRGNSGGYLIAATNMINEFLEPGDMIVYTEGKNSPRTVEVANERGQYKKNSIVVLIDEWSASASEIFAGAIQDNDRGLIIGRRSFGKGLVQGQYELGDGSALRLTIARYYTPSKRCIQKPYNEGKDYESEIYNRYLHGELDAQDSIRVDASDSTIYRTKKGRIVYGGGGIMPDIFVPRDTAELTTYYNKVNNIGMLYEYALTYTDEHRRELKELASASEIEAYMEKNDILTAFVNYADAKGIKRNPNLIQHSKGLLTNRLEAYVVRSILGDNEFYKIINSKDNTMRTAIEQLSNSNSANQ